jgi:hypothetical protein
MGLCGAIVAERSAYMIRRGPQHTIQWAWGGEICPFSPQGRRAVWVSINQASRRPDCVGKWDGTQVAGTPPKLMPAPSMHPREGGPITRARVAFISWVITIYRIRWMQGRNYPPPPSTSMHARWKLPHPHLTNPLPCGGGVGVWVVL